MSMVLALPGMPVQLTSFVGRSKELTALCALLPETRLLTLTGSGGSGKTRLALELAARFSGRFRDGVWLVELEALSDGGQVASHTVASLGATAYPDQPAIASLAQHLRAADALVVLDNCEHVVDDVATLVATLLRYCPDLRLLTTSREPLAIAGEVTFPVPPLTLPGTTELPPPEALRDFDAVRLFVDRARAADPSFELSARNASAVVEICEHLDGIPMAIELAASRVRGLTPTQIAERLSDRFHLLTSGNRTSLPRQQTLRALVDWSYDLLSEKEQAAWRRLAVFPSDFSLEGAEAVVPAGDVASYEVAELVDHLVSRSILSRTGAEQAVRYQMLETLRSYGRDRLTESGEEGAARTRLRAYVCAFAERRVVAWLDRYSETGRNDSLEADVVEFPLLRQEIAAAVAEGDRPAARLMGALVATWTLFGIMFEQAAATIAPILEMGDDDVGEGDMHLALCLGSWLGDAPWGSRSRHQFERALTLARAATGAGAEAVLAGVLNAFAIELLYVGDFEGAAAVSEEGARGSGAAALADMGRLAWATYLLGERERALEILDEAESKARLLDEPFLLGQILGQRSRIAMEEGRFGEAERLLVAVEEVGDLRALRVLLDCSRCILYALSDRCVDALRLITQLSDVGLSMFLPTYAGVVELALAEELPRRAALVSGIRSQASIAAHGRCFLRRIDAADERLLATLGEAEFAELRRQGSALHGLDRRQVVREITAEGLRSLSTRRTGHVKRTPRRPSSLGRPLDQREAGRLRTAPDPALEALQQMTELTLSRLRVVGAYHRYDERVRHELRDWSRRMTHPLVADTASHENFLVWAAPGSGKSFLVQESARSIEEELTYLELNLARLDREEFVDGLAEARACRTPLLCLLDEIDARGEEAWPCEEAFSLLDLNLEPERRAVFVLVGSHPEGMAAMVERIASRPKGCDLLDRVPVNHRFDIPSPALEDKAVIVASHLHHAGRQRGEPVEEIERLALYYALSEPSLTTPRQLRDLAVAAVQNLPAGELRLRYDDLFFRGDDRAYQFRRAHEAAAEELSGRYVALEG